MSKKQLTILGCGGHGQVIREIALLCNYEEVIFLDDSPTSCAAGKFSEFEKFKSTHDFIIGIGSNSVRQKLQEMLLKNGCNIATLIHPTAYVSSSAKIGIGSVIMVGSVVNTNAVVGDGAIVNTLASVDHDCALGNFSHMSAGARLGGTTKVGDRVFIGINSTVINNLTVCNDCLIGAGTLVLHNITESGTYVGVPARRIK